MQRIKEWISNINSSLEYGIFGGIIVPAICGILGSFIGMMIARLIGIL